MNWGFHNPQRSLTERKAKAVIFGQKSPNVKPNDRFHQVAPCVLNNHECTYESRQQAKIKHQQHFNSILQMREEYFKNRNLKENFTLLPKTDELMHKQMKRINIVEGSPRDKTKKKKRATKRESDAHVAGPEND